MKPAIRSRPFILSVLALGACAAGDIASGPLAGGAVSSASPEATAAGVRALAAGGNAIDAAVAIAFSLAVTEPAGSGLGGQAYLLVQRPGEAPFVVNGSTISPAATDPTATSADLRGHKATTVPSMVKVMDFAHRRFGSGNTPWADLLAPAAASAEDGFVLGSFRRNSIARYEAALRRDPEVARTFLRPDGRSPDVGDRIFQPALASTIRRLAEAGGEDFYRGEIAAEIARDMAANDGWLTLADLESFPEPKVGPPLSGRYRGFDVHTLPPPTGGWVVLAALEELSAAPAAELAAAGGARTIHMAEALRTAHDKRLTAPVYDGGGETTHFSVVDGDGMVVAATLSINAYFGAKVMSPKLGVLYNDYMREFEVGNPGHPFALRPDALPYSSMSATILSKDGVPQLGVGSPGSRRIISAVVQVVSNWVDLGLDVGAAVAAPRVHVVPEDSDLMLERRPARRDVLRELEQRGFSLAMPLSSLFAADRNPYFGGVHAVARTPAGEWRGGADPRRDGVAVPR